MKIDRRNFLALVGAIAGTQVAQHGWAQNGPSTLDRRKASMSMKISMPDGCGIYVESEGHGDTALIFLHGIMMSGAVFKHQVAALSGAYRVITVDLRGFGQSDKPETGYSEETFVADLKHVIDHLQLKRPIIAGWSMGGTVAMAFAARHPGIASRFALIGASPCLIQRPDWPDAVPSAAAEQIGQTLATDYGAGVDGFCRMMFPEIKFGRRQGFYSGRSCWRRRRTSR